MVRDNYTDFEGHQVPTNPKTTRHPRPTYSDGFKNGAVELYRTRRREQPTETHYATTMAVAKTMGISNITIHNWVKKAVTEPSDAQVVPVAVPPHETASPSRDSALATLVAVLGAPGAEPAPSVPEPAEEEAEEDPQATILSLRRRLAEVERANVILKSATAYLAAESLKAA